MAFGMMTGGKRMPQGDRTLTKVKAPKTGADDNEKTMMAGRETAPNMPMRDGPAKDKAGGKMAGKPKTSAPAKKGKPNFAAMRADLKKVGKF